MFEAEPRLTRRGTQLKETRPLTARNFDRTIKISGRGIDVAAVGEHACMRPERTGFERMIERYLGGGARTGRRGILVRIKVDGVRGAS